MIVQKKTDVEIHRDAVKVGQPATDAVRRAIERALERRAEREARDIDIEIHDGVVTLTGPVVSWPERKAVLGAARFTPGVRAVEDHLWPEID